MYNDTFNKTVDTVSEPESYDEMLAVKKAYPSVSFLLPVNKKYPHFKTEEQRLKAMIKNAEEKMEKELSRKLADSISEKLHKTLSTIDFSHLSQSIAMYVSPEVQKVIHLSFTVEEKLIIGRTFELRDLMYAAKNNFHYLVMALSQNKVRLFIGYNHYLEEVEHEEMPYGVNDTGGKGHSRVQSFSSFSSSVHTSDSQQHNEKKMEKFLYDVDAELSAVLKKKDIPLIIFGTKKATELFKKISANHKKTIGTLTGNFDLVPTHEMLEKVEPILKEQRETEQEKILKKLEKAMTQRMCVSGITEVWKAVMEKRGRLLVVEKNFRCQAQIGKNKFTLLTINIHENGANIIPDAVDDVIEYVYLYGGEVAFVENGSLKNHGGIALITYYA